MTTYTLNGQPLPYGPFEDAEGTNHPATVLDLWSDEELAVIGVARIPPPPPTLNDLKGHRLLELRGIYNTRMAGGFPAPSLGVGETLQLRNDTDRTNWLTLMIRTKDRIGEGQGGVVSPLAIRTTANNEYALTYSQIETLMDGMLDWAAATMAVSWAKKDQIESAADEAALAAIDLNTGWP